MRSACYFDEILDYLLSYELNSLIEDELYYYSNTSTIIYTDHPSGELDIERLMDDKPCWFSTCQSKQRVKKNIIICDWGLGSFESVYAHAGADENIYGLLADFETYIEHHLLCNGFKVFIWQQGELVQLQVGECLLKKYEVRKKITPAADTTIIEAAVAQHRLSYDSITLMHYHNNPFFKRKRTVDGHHALSLSELCHTPHHLKAIRDLYPHITHWSVEYLNVPTDVLEKFDAYFSDFTFSNLKHLAIDTSKPIHPKIQLFLTKSNNLEMLDFFNLSDNMLSQLITRINLAQIQRIEISHAKISSYEINTLFAHTPKLAQLTFTNFTLTDDIHIPPVYLPYLKQLTLETVNQYSCQLLSCLLELNKIEYLFLTNPPDEWAILIKNILHKHSELSITINLPDGKEQNFIDIIGAKIGSKLRIFRHTGVTTETYTSQPEDWIFTPIPDEDTSFEEKIHKVTQVFQPLGGIEELDVDTYRLSVFNTVSVVSDKYFSYENQTDLMLAPISQPSVRDADANHYQGKQAFLDLTTHWMPIASLSPKEILISYSTTPEKNIEIQYAHRDNLYYIRSLEGPMSIPLDFELQISKRKEQITDTRIVQLVEYFQSFNAGPLVRTDAGLVMDLYTQKVGACRHRALAFKCYLQEHFPELNVRVIFNDCHAFVEIMQNNAWITCDLGGYESALDYQPIAPLLQPIKPQLVKPSLVEQSIIATPFLPSKKYLLLSEHQTILSHHLYIQAQAKRENQPVFYAHTAQDLTTRTFRCFLENTQSLTPIIILNYARFIPEEIIRYAALKNYLLPQHAIVIGLMDPSLPTAYTGQDFYEQFDEIKKLSTEAYDTRPFVLNPLIDVQELSDKYAIINLFHSEAWKTLLMGSPVIKNGVLFTEESPLKQALQSNKPILIQNPPIDEQFDIFWQLAHIQESIQYQQQTIPFPPTQTIFFAHGYDWSILAKKIELATASDLVIPLNPSRLSLFLKQYKIQDGYLNKTDGIFATDLDKPLAILVTRNLSEDEWGVFFNAYAKYPDRVVKMAFSEGVDPPQGFIPQLQPMHIPNTHNTHWVDTDDADHVILTLKKNNPDIKIKVLDISESTISDLTTQLVPVETNKFQFEEKNQVLSTALNNNEYVVLTGFFSDTLIDHLTALRLERAQQGYKSLGYLVILHEPITKQYQSLLPGFNNIATVPILPSFSPSTCHDDAIQFVVDRRLAIHHVLKNQPFVFLAGLTGVGKSTFIEQDFVVDPSQQRLFMGEDQLLEWAEAPCIPQPILFIDEANLSPRQWSEFEGLFQDPPHIFIKGQYLEVSPEHKVIFAGNPLSYGDERSLARLFHRHGNSIIFDPLTPAFIYERIIRPIFQNSHLKEEQIQQIASVFFEVYAFIVQRSKIEIRISPREIQMMALLTWQKHMQNPSVRQFLTLAKHYAYHIGAPLVSINDKEDFSLIFADYATQYAYIPPKNSDCLYLPSRVSTLQFLDDYLALHHFRHTRSDINETQRYGGLGGLIIEGNPGSGKSLLVKSYLARYAEFNIVEIPMLLKSNEKQALLIKAFNQGAVVLMENLNTEPMMERLLNQLLMGKNPDGSRPTNPGFFLIGIQSPASMAGRRLVSAALERRVQTCSLPPHTLEELELINTHQNKKRTLEVSDDSIYSQQSFFKKPKTFDFEMPDDIISETENDVNVDSMEFDYS